MPIVEILNATTFTSLRSMASKLVSSEELGENGNNILNVGFIVDTWEKGVI